MSCRLFSAGECDCWGKENLLDGLITDLGKTRFICTPLGKAHDVENRLWSRVATENLPHMVYHHYELQFIRLQSCVEYGKGKHSLQFEAKVNKENLHACVSRWKSSFWH